jgi:hypothetical protein
VAELTNLDLGFWPGRRRFGEGPCITSIICFRRTPPRRSKAADAGRGYRRRRRRGKVGHQKEDCIRLPSCRSAHGGAAGAQLGRERPPSTGRRRRRHGNGSTTGLFRAAAVELTCPVRPVCSCEGRGWCQQRGSGRLGGNAEVPSSRRRKERAVFCHPARAAHTENEKGALAKIQPHLIGDDGGGIWQIVCVHGWHHHCWLEKKTVGTCPSESGWICACPDIMPAIAAPPRRGRGSDDCPPRRRGAGKFVVAVVGVPVKVGRRPPF